MKKEVKVIRDTPSIKICVEDTRSKILSLLRVRDMSISQLAEALDKDQSTIYRHLKKLQNAGYVEISGKRKEHHIPEKLYGRTASIFILSPTDGDTDDESISKSWQRRHTERVAKLMEILGYDVDISEELIEDLASFFSMLDKTTDELIERSQDKISEMNYPTLLRLKLLLFILEIMDNDDVKEEAERILNSFTK